MEIRLRHEGNGGINIIAQLISSTFIIHTREHFECGFMNALENLTITITDEQGTVIMEDNISGETGECITIILNNESTGRFT